MSVPAGHGARQRIAPMSDNSAMTEAAKELRIAGSSLLLVLTAFTIFGVPLFDEQKHELLYSLSFTAIFILAALAVDKKRKLIVGVAVVAIISEWVTSYGMPRLNAISQIVNIGFFMLIVGAMIGQIARTERVGVRVIIAAVSGYLLLGLALSLMIVYVIHLDPEAISLPAESTAKVSDTLYYGFVTFTTVGYGDITPQKPYARSLAMLVGMGGQLYIAIIIATLVGKFSGGGKPD